jgi:serine/threonine protein kinase
LPSFIFDLQEADLSTKYEIIETLGRGSAGEVFIVQRNQAASSCSAFELNKLAVDEPCEKKLVAGSQSDSPVEAIMPAPTGRTTATPPTLKRRRFAMKTFYLDRIDNSLLREFENEIKLLQELHHPHIISLKEVFLDRKRTRVCMLMDLCRGGDLGSVGIMNEIQVRLGMPSLPTGQGRKCFRGPLLIYARPQIRRRVL